TLSVAALASLGLHSITATTGGQVATLASAFGGQPGTPLLLSSGPGAGAQQQAFTLTILGQYSSWDNTTTVSLGAGVRRVHVSVTRPTGLTADVVIDPLTYLGPRTLTVTTGSQVLTINGALGIVSGPAAIQQIVPAQVGQASTQDIEITGVNTHFSQATTS